MRPMTHYRVAVFIEDFSQLPGRWEWATVRGIPFKHYDRKEAEALASFGNANEARVLEIPAGADPETVLQEFRDLVRTSN